MRILFVFWLLVLTLLSPMMVLAQVEWPGRIGTSASESRHD